MPREKTNFDINGERLLAFMNQFDSYYTDGSSLEDWKKHPELFTADYEEDDEDYDPDDYDDPDDYGNDEDDDEDEDDVEVNKDSRFLK